MTDKKPTVQVTFEVLNVPQVQLKVTGSIPVAPDKTWMDYYKDFLEGIK